MRNKNTGKILKPEILRSGYYSVRVNTYNRNTKLHIIIHKAVAHTFISNPNNYPEVNHKDGNKLNNSVDNLEWCSSRQNQQHKYDIGLFNVKMISGENNHNSKLTWDIVHYIRENCVVGSKTNGMNALARMFNVSKTTISDVFHYKIWLPEMEPTR